MAHQAGVSQEAMPAAALRGARGIGWVDVWGDSLGQGTAGLVGWFLGYHHHQVILPPSCPSLLLAPLYQATGCRRGEREFSQPPW